MNANQGPERRPPRGWKGRAARHTAGAAVIGLAIGYGGCEAPERGAGPDTPPTAASTGAAGSRTDTREENLQTREASRIILQATIQRWNRLSRHRDELCGAGGNRGACEFVQSYETTGRTRLETLSRTLREGGAEADAERRPEWNDPLDPYCLMWWLGRVEEDEAARWTPTCPGP